MKKLFTTLLLVIAVVSVTSAQVDRTGKFAIGIDGVTSPNLAGKYFISNNFAMELTAGFNLYSPGGDAVAGQTKVTGTDFRIGLAVLYHLGEGDFVPYVGIDGCLRQTKTADFSQLSRMPKTVFKPMWYWAENILLLNSSVSV